jgi:hypothetical protein
MGLKGTAMASTKALTESFILSEAPPVRSKCVLCGEAVKHSLTDTDQPVILKIEYEPNTIYFFNGGRCFEEIDRSYLHVCPQADASFANCFRNTVIGQPAVF